MSSFSLFFFLAIFFFYFQSSRQHTAVADVRGQSHRSADARRPRRRLRCLHPAAGRRVRRRCRPSAQLSLEPQTPVASLRPRKVLTEEEAKAEAADITVVDGPNEDGEMYERAGKLTDPLPKPYPNEEAARAANNNAYPPDLSLIVQARPHGNDYLFALLTGYKAPPAGLVLGDNMYYNPYFFGGQIGMAQALKNGILEYEDGTEASISQMAKDVSTFLCWAAKPEQDDRHKLGLKTVLLLALAAVPTLYWKRLKWSVIKTRQVRILR